MRFNSLTFILSSLKINIQSKNLMIKNAWKQQISSAVHCPSPTPPTVFMMPVHVEIWKSFKNIILVLHLSLNQVRWGSTTEILKQKMFLHLKYIKSKNLQDAPEQCMHNNALLNSFKIGRCPEHIF